MITKTTKNTATDTEYAESKQGASLFFFLALIEPYIPQRANTKNTIDTI